MYRRPRRDEWYGPSYGHHYPTAHWPISVLSVPRVLILSASSLVLCLPPFTLSLSCSFSPVLTGSRPSSLRFETFRRCIETRHAHPVMPRNFKGPRRKQTHRKSAEEERSPYENDLFSIPSSLLPVHGDLCSRMNISTFPPFCFSGILTAKESPDETLET